MKQKANLLKDSLEFRGLYTKPDSVNSTRLVKHLDRP